jgi:hypothetical protein
MIEKFGVIQRTAKRINRSMLGVVPLTDVAMNHIQTEFRVPDGVASTVRESIYSHLNGQMSLAAAAEVLQLHIGTARPLEQISAIVHINDIPLPARPTSQMSRKRCQEWTRREDQRLLAGIYRYGLGNWRSIADFVGNNRTRAQCCQRWCRGLDPSIIKGNWTRETDDRLLVLVAIHGDKCWSQIAADLGNRCDVQCRYRYHQLAKSTAFEERMRIAREKTAGIPHQGMRPRKRPARNLGPKLVLGRVSTLIPRLVPDVQTRTAPEKVKLPPIEELAGIAGVKPQLIIGLN